MQMVILGKYSEIRVDTYMLLVPHAWIANHLPIMGRHHPGICCHIEVRGLPEVSDVFFGHVHFTILYLVTCKHQGENCGNIVHRWAAHPNLFREGHHHISAPFASISLRKGYV